MKGIILAAGRGTRLYPMTKPVCKPLLPIYDKPLIYYPLSTLIQAGCDEVMVIVPPGEDRQFFNLFGDGSALGMSIRYREQLVPRGIADALILAEDFIAGERVCLALGDNIFYSESWQAKLEEAARCGIGASVFGIWTEDPRPFGVVEFDRQGHAISIEEKPQTPKSNFIIPGVYFYDGTVSEIARALKPSARGELEITDVNVEYMRRGLLSVIELERGVNWIDTGTADNLYKASGMIREIQKNSGRLVGCIEEDVWRRGWITKAQLRALGEGLSMTDYGKYLLNL